MAKRSIDYGRMVEQALRTVVRDVLTRVANEGLGGQHHFYITFRTTDPGVELSDYLRDRYPNEMTIVLQYQFWGLEVEADRFAVTLSFNNVSERIGIPFTALKVFADPAAEFGLQFTIEPDQRVVSLPTQLRLVDDSQGNTSAEVVPLLPAAANPDTATARVDHAPDAASDATKAEPQPEAVPEPAGEPSPERVAERTEPRPGAEIVTLDRFRKK